MPDIPPHPHGGYPPPYPYPGFPPPSRRENGLAVASLVIGIVALAASVSLVGGVFFGVIATVMGLIAHRRTKHGDASHGGMAIVGIVLGVTATVVSSFIIWLAFGTELFNEDYQHCLGYHMGDEQACEQYR